jgi:hypothetical protein
VASPEASPVAGCEGNEEYVGLFKAMFIKYPGAQKLNDENFDVQTATPSDLLEISQAFEGMTKELDQIEAEGKVPPIAAQFHENHRDLTSVSSNFFREIATNGIFAGMAYADKIDEVSNKLDLDTALLKASCPDQWVSPEDL